MVTSIALVAGPLPTDCKMSVFNKVCRLLPVAIAPPPAFVIPFKVAASSLASILDGCVKVSTEEDDVDDDDGDDDDDPCVTVEEEDTDDEDEAAAA